MDTETPPKRITRSRATAKNTIAEPEVKIATAAAKAKATGSTIASTTKRKTRADDVVEVGNIDDFVDELAMDAMPSKPKVTRGRKKAVQVEPEIEPAPTKATRGRPKKVIEETPAPEQVKTTRGRAMKVLDEPPASEPSVATRGRSKKAIEEQAPSEPVAATRNRGRPKKADSIEETAPEAAAEPTRKATRGRAATTTKTVALRKTVKFEEAPEQDKENIVPPINKTKDKGKDVEVSTGLRAKPVRRPAAGTRARARATAGTKKTPLSPKKATQVATAKDAVSEDELATMEKTPMKPLVKSPARAAPGSVITAGKRLDFTASIIANRAATQDPGNSLMGSPARRPPPSPYKDAIKTSPKRFNLCDSMPRSLLKDSMQRQNTMSPNKLSLLQSPAKRPQSPMKVSILDSPSRTRHTNSVTPSASKFSLSKFNATPRTLGKSAVRPSRPLFGGPSKQSTAGVESTNTKLEAPVEKFPGRLSCILPRNADPALRDSPSPSKHFQLVGPNNGAISVKYQALVEPIEDAMDIDEQEPAVDVINERLQSTTPPHSPPRYSIGGFNAENEDPFHDSDVEDELVSGSPKHTPAPLGTFGIASRDFADPATPTPFDGIHKTPKTATMYRSTAADTREVTRSQSVRVRREKDGVTPLPFKMDDWVSAFAARQSSASLEEEAHRSPSNFALNKCSEVNDASAVEHSHSKNSFFEDAMSVSNEAPEPFVDIAFTESNDGLDAMDFAPTTLDEEDLALAAEADEMSLLSAGTEEEDWQVVHMLNQSIRDDSQALSEASQEYGDENAIPAEHNAMPIDPALLILDTQDTSATPLAPNSPVVFTPVRSFGERERVFHTVSKVPLKPAAEDSPLQISKRSASASKLTAQREAPAAPSFSVTKLQLDQPANASPAQSNNWSTAATPVRTPRRDVNCQVLKGAVVYVDVHTTEGADASAVFVELLGQMGAKCVKGWSWNPNSISGSPENGEQATNNNKIGITHVVFKDGGKRTLEKVREAKGVVLCVGVAWVLEYVFAPVLFFLNRKLSADHFQAVNDNRHGSLRLPTLLTPP